MVEGCVQYHIIPNLGQKLLQNLKPKAGDVPLPAGHRNHLQAGAEQGGYQGGAGGGTGHVNAKMVTDICPRIQDKNRWKMAKALERVFLLPQRGEVIQPELPVSEQKKENNRLLLQKLADDPQALQTLMAILQQGQS